MIFLVVSAFTCWPGGLARLPLEKGYSAAWLVILFLFGGALREFASRRTIRPLRCFLFAGAMVGVMVAQRLVLSSIPRLRALFADEWTLLPYTSPTVVLMAAALLLGLAHLEIRSRLAQKAIGVLAPCAFGVYLLHVQPLFFASVWKGSLAAINALPDALFVLAILAVVVLVYLVCTALELLRRTVCNSIAARVEDKRN